MITFNPFTFILALCMGCLGAYLAHKQRRSIPLWFLIGLLFGALGIYILYFIARKGRKHKKSPATAKTVPPPAPTINGPQDKFWYYLDPSHQQVGPISFHALARALQQGSISPDTYVWHEDLSDWKPLKDCR